MRRGRKSKGFSVSFDWQEIFWQGLPTYISIINSYLTINSSDLIKIGQCLEKLSFNVPKGLNSIEINSKGSYPVISQSQEYIIGYSDKENLVVDKDLPLIVFGDHSKTIKYVDQPFIIGADGVKLLKPQSKFTERFFYYFLHGVITDTKDYGRHFKLLRDGFMPDLNNLELQNSIVEFLDNLKDNSIQNEKIYFDEIIENQIIGLQKSQCISKLSSIEFLDQQSLVKRLRQQLLQDAIQGKLVEQDINDEPASLLLNKLKTKKEQLIKDKKLKKEKELPQIRPEEIPFEIPDNWVWCKMGEIAYITSGSTPSQDAFVSHGIPYLKMYNLKNQKIDFDYKPQYIKEEVHNGQLKRCRAYPGDILMNIVGPPLGKIAIIPDHLDQCNFNQAAVLIRPMFKEMNVFIFWYLNEMSEINSIDTKGVAGQANISVTQAHNIKIALPPLNEQHQIVEKLEQLLKTSDALEASIRQSQQQNEQLLQQVLREALTKELEQEVI